MLRSLRDPFEVLDRLRGRLEWFLPQGPPSTPSAHDAHEAIHSLVPRRSPCLCGEFDDVWRETTKGLLGIKSADAGRTYGFVLWSVVTHTRPRRLVETGVGRGISSAIILTALHRIGEGQLVSIDLPPLRPAWVPGEAVDGYLRDRWAYIRGSSRRRLPPILKRLGAIDLFAHDSGHTRRNMAWEFRMALKYSRSGTVVVADDVDKNAAFAEFSSELPAVTLAESRKGGAVGVAYVKR